MQLQRAIELCQGPIDASRSHIVRVDRYALIHALKDREEHVSLSKNQASKITGLESSAVQQTVAYEKLKIENKVKCDLIYSHASKINDLETAIKVKSDFINSLERKIKEDTAKAKDLINSLQQKEETSFAGTNLESIGG